MFAEFARVFIVDNVGSQDRIGQASMRKETEPTRYRVVVLTSQRYESDFGAVRGLAERLRLL
jgi:hypothetical protein